MNNAFFPELFKRGHIGPLTLKNRIVRNSMGTYLGNPDGSVTDRQIKAYAQAAEGGAGLVFMDNVTPVEMESCGLRADVIGASQITYEPWYQMGAKLPRR